MPVTINTKEIIDADITSFSKKSVKKPSGSNVIKNESAESKVSAEKNSMEFIK